MKTERLYAITVYLLNHGRTSAAALAERFEVSVRTIQRDMDSLCLAGIPVVSAAGPSGGYELSGQFVLEKHLAAPCDYSCILTALKGLVSATGDRNAENTLEKVANLFPQSDSGILLDFSVLQEGGQAVLQTLQTAIAQKRVVEFFYTNNDGESRIHRVEPVAVLYRWYAWYLLAYSTAKNDYRTYKLIRMENAVVTDAPFTREHAAAETILRASDQADSRQYTEVLVKCSKPARARVREYLKGTVTEEFPDGSCLMTLTVVPNELFWIGALLSLGDAVEVLAPQEIRQQVIDTASKIVSRYPKP